MRYAHPFLCVLGLFLVTAISLSQTREPVQREAPPRDPGRGNEAVRPLNDVPAKQIGLPVLQGKDKPRLVTDSGGHSAPVRAAFFHPGGDNIITVSADKTVRLWDVGTGELMLVYPLPIGPDEEGSLQAGDISPDGRFLAVGGLTVGRGKHGFLVYLINIESNQIEKVFSGHKRTICDLRFSNSGTLLASASHDGIALVHDIKTGKTTQMLQGHRQGLHRVRFSHDDQLLATASYDRTARIWSVADGKQTAVLNELPDEVIAVAWHPKEHTLATSCVNGEVQLWKADGTRTHNFPIDPEDRIQAVNIAFSADGADLMYGGVSRTGLVGLYDFKAQKIRRKFTEHNNTVLDARFSPDGKMAITTGGDNHETFVWNVADGKVVQRFHGAGKSVWGVGWRLDGKAFAWGNSNRGDTLAGATALEHTFLLDDMQLGGKPDPKEIGRIASQHGDWSLRGIDFFKIGFVKNGVTVHEFQSPAPGDRIYSATIVPGRRAIIGASFGMYLVDMPTAKVLREYRAHNGIILSVSPSPDGRHFLSGSLDQTICLWDIEREEPLVSLFVVGREWIAWTPQGYYACSAYGERLMGWQVNNGIDKLAAFHPAARFRGSLYQPNLVKLIFQERSFEKALILASQSGAEPVASVSVSQVLPPSVEMLEPAGTNAIVRGATVQVRAKAKSTGDHPITGMRLLVDGRPYLGDKGLKKFDPPKKGEVEASWEMDVLPGKHSIAVVAESPVSKGMSRWAEVNRVGASAEELPSMYVVSAGISRYPAGMALQYAHKDAIVLDKTLRASFSGVFRKVETKLLTDRQATRQNILDSLTWLEKSMTAKDVAVLFLAGHGSRDDKGQFHFIPVDIDRGDMEKSCVGGDLLKKKLANLPGRVLVILDACHSGAASSKKKSITDDLVRNLVSDDVGIVVMCSSQGTEYSLEGKNVEHGFFTMGLVEALTGRADFNNDGYIYLHEADFYTLHRVRQLSDGEQNPTTGRPQHLRSFPLARVK